MLNTFSLMLRRNTAANIPLAGQFGQLMEHLSTAQYVHSPPDDAQLKGTLTHIKVTTKCCANCLTEKLKEAGFDVTVGSTNLSEHTHETCSC